jgi:hypothetical protein
MNWNKIKTYAEEVGVLLSRCGQFIMGKLWNSMVVR